MTRKRSPHRIVGTAAVFMILAVGAATASNFAFKFRAVIYRSAGLGAGTGNCSGCINWVSLPLRNPFTEPSTSPIHTCPACDKLNPVTGLYEHTLRDFCDTNGNGRINTFLNPDAGDLISIVQQPGQFLPANMLLGLPIEFEPDAVDSRISHNCDVNQPPPAVYDPTRPLGLVGRRLSAIFPAGDAVLTFVGSDVPGQPIVVLNAGQGRNLGGHCVTANAETHERVPGSVCDHWITLLYHTTARNARDLCDTNFDGLINSADSIHFISVTGRRIDLLLPVRGNSNFDPTRDTFVTHNCDISISDDPALGLGAGIRIRLRGSVTSPRPDFAYMQPHF